MHIMYNTFHILFWKCLYPCHIFPSPQIPKLQPQAKAQRNSDYDELQPLTILSFRFHFDNFSQVWHQTASTKDCCKVKLRESAASSHKAHCLQLTLPKKSHLVTHVSCVIITSKTCLLRETIGFYQLRHCSQIMSHNSRYMVARNIHNMEIN